MNDVQCKGRLLIGVKLKIFENRDIVSMRRDFKICICSYFSVEEYIKMIKQTSDLYESTSFLFLPY